MDKSRRRAEKIHNQSKLDQFWKAAFIENTVFHESVWISCINYTICVYYSSTEEKMILFSCRTFFKLSLLR